MTERHSHTSSTLDNRTLQTTVVGVVLWLMKPVDAKWLLAWTGSKGFEPKSYAGLTVNKQVDELARQGRLGSPLWTANKVLLIVHKKRERE